MQSDRAVSNSKISIYFRDIQCTNLPLLTNRAHLQWEPHFHHTNGKILIWLNAEQKTATNHFRFKISEVYGDDSANPSKFSKNELWLLEEIYCKNWDSMKTMCTRKAAMLTGNNLERMSIWELLTLICPALMYVSLLLLAATETFTAKEPEQQLESWQK